MREFVLLALALSTVCAGAAAQEIELQPNLKELEADVRILVALDEATGRVDRLPSAIYMKHVLQCARKRKSGCRVFLSRIPEDKRAEVYATFKCRFQRQFVRELERTVERSNSKDYRNLDRWNARIVRLACLMRTKRLENVRQLAELLPDLGTTIERQQQAWFEYYISRQGEAAVARQANK